MKSMSEKNQIFNENDLKKVGSGKSYKVLVIDDDTWYQRVFGRILQNIGFEHIAADNPFDGLSKMIQEKPHLVFLDYLLPEISGLQLLKMMKKIERIENIPVIFLSAHLDKNIILSSKKLGAADFIIKPFNDRIIIQKLKSNLDETILMDLNLDNDSILETDI